MPDSVTLGRTLAALRAAHGWTQEELGEAAGVDKAQVSRYERGVDEPSMRTLAALAEALRATPSELHLLRDRLDRLVSGRPAPPRTPLTLADLSFLGLGPGPGTPAAGEEGGEGEGSTVTPADDEVDRIARDVGRLAERLVRLHFQRLKRGS